MMDEERGIEDHEIEWREAHGLPIRYCMTHGCVRSECGK